MVGEQIGRPGGKPHDLIPVDGIDERLPGGEVAEEGSDPDARLACDLAHGRLGARSGEDAGGHREQGLAVARRVGAETLVGSGGRVGSHI